MSISSTLSIDHSNISFLQSIFFPIFTHSLSVEPPSVCFFLSLSNSFFSHSISLLHSIFSPFSIFPLHSFSFRHFWLCHRILFSLQVFILPSRTFIRLNKPVDGNRTELISL